MTEEEKPKEIKREEWSPPETTDKKEGNEDYLTLEKGFLMFDNAKRIKFGEGNNTVKISIQYGLWAGNQIFDLAPFKIYSSGTIYVNSIILNNTATLPTTGIVGELRRSSGTLYICTQASPVIWSVVGKQN